MIFLSALLLGLGGSIHCIAMCGPIALSLPLTAREKSIVLFQSLLYNLGRISTYALMGFFFGWMGWGIGFLGYQNVFSIGLGFLLIATAFFTLPAIGKKLFRQFTPKLPLNKITSQLGKLLSSQSQYSAYRIGLLNGLLPCGLVYVALAGSFTSGNYWSGAMYMIAFGLGTLPLMFGVMIFGNWLKPFLINFQKIIPYGLFLFGGYLIYRGIMLEIPEELGFMQIGNWGGVCR